jgi:hypothetical protein
VTVDQQLSAAEARLTELQHAFVNATYDADERSRLVDQIRATRREITRLYNLLPV